MITSLLRATWRATLRAMPRAIGVGLALHAFGAAAATASVSGTVSYPDGTPDPQVFVVLYQCATPDELRCSAYQRDTGTDSSGHYTIAFDGLDTTATYQLTFTDWSGRDGTLPLVRSALFSPGSDALTIDGQLRPWKLSLSGVAWDQASVPVGGSANLGFTVTNTSGAPIALDAWMEVVVAPTGSAAESSYFQRGAGGKVQPLALSLSTGETRTVSLPFAVPTGALSGSGGAVTLWVSLQGKPTAIVSADDGLYFTITQAGTTTLQSGAAARAQRVGQMRSERLQLLRAPAVKTER